MTSLAARLIEIICSLLVSALQSVGVFVSEVLMAVFDDVQQQNMMEADVNCVMWIGLD